MRLLALYFLLILTGSFRVIAQPQAIVSQRFFNNFEDSILNGQWMNANTIMINTGSGNHFSRTDSGLPYSSGIEVAIPEDLQRKNIRIAIGALVRTETHPFHCQLVISAAAGDSAVAWKGFVIPDSSAVNKEWSPIKYSILLPRSLPVNSKIKIFLWNDGGKSTVDIDDFEIVFTEEKFPSFLPARSK